MKYFAKLILAYINRFKGIILIGIVIGALIFLIFSNLIPLFSKNTDRIGISGRYQTDDLPSYILSMIGNGLTDITPEQTVEPALASSWETPDNGKTWKFHLKNDIKWQDGQPVTSQNVEYNFSDVETKVEDLHTLTFKLKAPFSPFPSVVSKPVFKKGLLGTGNWKVKKLTVKGSFVEELYLIDPEGNQTLFRFYPTVETTKTAFKLGQVDKILNIIDTSPFDNWPNVQILRTVNKNQVVTLFFNTQDKLLSDKSLRQALTYAINKDIFANRALTPITPNSWAYNSQVKEYSYDKERAKEILKDLKKNLLADSKIKILTTSDLLKTADSISNDWKAIGVDSTVLVSTVIPTDFQVLVTIMEIPKDPDQYTLWHSTQSQSNISKYSSARVDKLLEEGRTVTNIEDRKKIYYDFQRFLIEDVPAVFLFYPTYYTIERK